MLISIVTAVWNRAGTVGQALASVQSQTHADLEHIIQDGGSTDGTCAILEAQADPRTKLVSMRDTGLYDALNRGLARSTGDVVGLVHSDDYLAAPDILACIAEVFADPNVDAVYGDLDYIAADGASDASAAAPRVVRRWRSGPFRPALLARGWMPPHPTLYLRRRVLERHGGFDTSFRIAADYDAVLRYFSQPGFKAVHVPRVFVKMRMGGVSNASLRHILLKSREDYRALRQNRIGGAAGPLPALLAKNLGKIGQFTGQYTGQFTGQIAAPTPDIPAPDLPAHNVPAPGIAASDMLAPDIPVPDLPRKDSI